MTTGTGDSLPENLLNFCKLEYDPDVSDSEIDANCFDFSAADTDYTFDIGCGPEDIEDVLGTDPSKDTTLTWTVTLSGLYSPDVVEIVQAGVKIKNPCADLNFAAIEGDDLESQDYYIE